jgi:probable phosphoglycerate mutase
MNRSPAATPPPVLLTRHGLSEHNLETRVYMGRSPASRLVAEGRRQALALGAYLSRTAPVQRIVASSLPRTLETAELIAGQLGHIPVQGDDAFWELSKGSWEGSMPRENVPEPERSAWEQRPFEFRFPQGESYALVAARVAPAFEGWIARCGQERLLFVLHGDVLCALLYRLLHFPAEDIRRYVVLPCSLTEVVRAGGEWRMPRFSEHSFLTGEPDNPPGR